MKCCIVSCLLFLSSCLNHVPDFPYKQYELMNVEGWTVAINKKVSEQEILYKVSTLALKTQLQQIKDVIPRDKIKKLQQVMIWFETDFKGYPQYHPDKTWLKENNVLPQKHRCVEFPKVNSMVTALTGKQPWIVLHELSHAYHHQVLGFDNEEILKAYKRVLKSKIYSSVLNSHGLRTKAYAIKDHKEFFAEMTECYFGKNNYYPFNNNDLKRYDPKTHALIKKLWFD